jgi:spore germination protein GerM
LIGIALIIILIFRQEISDTFKTRGKRKDIFREKKMVLLYFSDRDDEYLVGEKREIIKRGEVNLEAEETILELIKGPKGKLVPTLPPRTKLLALHVNEKGVAEVNFSRAFSKDHPGGSSAEMMTIYSIVNSLTLNFPQIKKVQILIEGETGETIAGHLSLDQPISFKPDLIKRQ